MVWNENQVKLELFEFIYIHYFQSKETSDNILQMLFESSTTINFFKNFVHKLFTTEVFENYFDFGGQELFCFGINLSFFICEFNTA